MGGMGSGNWYRFNAKDTVEAQHKIDVRYMRRHGVLTPGYSGSFTWNRGERETGRIGFAMHESLLVLSYRYRQHGGEWQDVSETIRLTYTSCHYGGRRPWFVCPSCGRRIAVLCGVGRLFLCRHCYDLTYESRHENPMTRLQSKAQKIRQRLGGSGSIAELFPDKPRWMHWSTYQRLYQQADDAEHGSLLALSDWMTREDEMRAAQRGRHGSRRQPT